MPTAVLLTLVAMQEDVVVVNGYGREAIDATEVFEHIRDISDPEHPYTLEQLNVVEEERISVDDTGGYVK